VIFWVLVAQAAALELPSAEWVADTESFREAALRNEDLQHAGFNASFTTATVRDLNCSFVRRWVARCTYEFRIDSAAGEIVRDWTRQTSDFTKNRRGEWTFSLWRETGLSRG
jgi:uncharacterized sporulation protein YeaH/YhbH (DUF444 family)